MAVTSFNVVSDRMILSIEGIIPTWDQSIGFVRSDSKLDFREWAEANPQAATRRFDVKNLNVWSDVQISNHDEVLEPGRCEIVIAYQPDFRWGRTRTIITTPGGPSNLEINEPGGDLRQMYDVIEEDRIAIDKVVGINATDYLDACTHKPEFAVEELENIHFLVIGYEFVFYRDV